MSLILATGSNLGNSLQHLKEAKTELSKHFSFIAESRVYKSEAVDYENQPDFFNQVLEFALPASKPEEVMKLILKIEKTMGRTREILRGPRTIDIDMIFWELKQINSEHLIVPHPRWLERSFVVRPIQELPFFQTIKKCYKIPTSFTVEATPV